MKLSEGLGPFHGGNGGGGDARALIESRLRVVRVTHFGFLVTLLLCAVFVHLIRGVHGTSPVVVVLVPIPPIRGLLYGVGALALGAVLILKPRLLSVEGLGHPPAERALAQDILLLQGRYIVLMGIAEVAVICGVLLFLLGGLLTDFYLMAALSLLGLLAVIPHRDLWEGLARRLPP